MKIRKAFRLKSLSSISFTLLALASISSFSSEEKNSVKEPKVGKEAPLFKGKTVEEQTLELNDFRGKVVLIDFWASWCGPCRQEIPHLQEAYELYHKSGLEIVSVNVNENSETIKQFTQKTKMPWKHVLDEDGKISSLYKVQFIPSVFLLDHTGKLMAEGNDLRGNRLLKIVEKYIKQIPPKE
ncbi:MAG: TlpA family protein disulfide reductase [Candidatus Omnitrophota bacterium]|jgi:thiol-disulfide isomerase/thioredoxin|nr:MAG: TlpA family protein disulfide reductase [Candidatus Omnitrophota bacterium]